jgi:cytochrome oxidase Cu insertion factor (SCO1/SenC/PrrC family)
MSQRKQAPVTNPRREAARRTRERRRRRGQITVAAAVSVAALLAGSVVASVIIDRGKGGDASTGQPASSSAPTAAGDNRAIASNQVDSTSRSVGKVFPDFELMTPDGEQVTRASLAGKPSIIWFTIKGCIPCEQGAPKVARIDDEAGGKAFGVLVVFIDPRESTDTLTRWRDTFGRPDWTVALDSQNELTNAVKVQYLDTKFLLDERGKILNVDVQPVNDNYLRIVQDAIKT